MQTCTNILNVVKSKKACRSWNPRFEFNEKVYYKKKLKYNFLKLLKQKITIKRTWIKFDRKKKDEIIKQNQFINLWSQYKIVKA